MPYSDYTDVLRVSGIPGKLVSSGDIAVVIEKVDAKILEDLGSEFTGTPEKIAELSALMASVKLASRLDVRFKLGEDNTKMIDANIKQWREDIESIYESYGVSFSPSGSPVPDVAFVVGTSE